MNKKAIFITTVAVGVVATPIGITLAANANSYKDNPYKVTLSTMAPIKTLNKFKASSTSEAEAVGGFYMNALFKNRPSGDANGGLETSLSVHKLGFNTTVGLENTRIEEILKTQKNITELSDDKFVGEGHFYAAFTSDLAEKMNMYQDPSHKVNAVGIKLRDNARFWNGDRVTAEDLIETIKVALNVKNGVPWAWSIYKIVGFKNASNIWNAQTIEGLTFEEALAKYPLGIVPAEEIPVEDMSLSQDGKEYYRREYSNGNKRHSKLIYLFDKDARNFIPRTSLGVICSPTNIRHFEKVGLDNWGTSIDNMMGSGPFKPVYFDLDYKIVSNKWDGYWDADRTISPQIEMRVMPDVSSQIQLFRDGKVGKVTFGTAMLPQFLGDINLKKYVKPTNFAENLGYIAFNTKVENYNSKYLLNSNLRNAIQYSIDRTQYLSALSADNSYPEEAFSTLQFMNDSSGKTVINHTLNFQNESKFILDNKDNLKIWNTLYNLPTTNNSSTNEKNIFHRSEEELLSTSWTKNNRKDYQYLPDLGKSYFEKFKKENPGFNGIKLRVLVVASNKEQVTIIKQNIEDNLKGVEIEIVPKPVAVEPQIASKYNWDMRITNWSQDYFDPWTFYHLVSDKVTKTNDADPLSSSRMNQNVSSDGYSLVEYVAQKLFSTKTEGEYFAEHYMGDAKDAKKLKAIKEIIAQFLRMESTIGSNSPNNNAWKVGNKLVTGYDENIWDMKPTQNNGFNGYSGEFDKYETLFKGSKEWGNKLKQFIEDNKQPADENQDLWKNTDYRFQILYPFIEKLIRESAIGIPLTRTQNKYIASRFIGEANIAGQIVGLGFLYQANHIPPSKFPLPGEEAIIK